MTTALTPLDQEIAARSLDYALGQALLAQQHTLSDFSRAVAFFSDTVAATTLAAEDYTRVLDMAYEEACISDPGLPRAVFLARLSNPQIGWLEVEERRHRRVFGYITHNTHTRRRNTRTRLAGMRRHTTANRLTNDEVIELVNMTVGVMTEGR